ncbi:MAG: hypothetical protein KAT70_00475, partial [Thermoplasmata archaeon]|nr:hypothetical protein [Thermoplasmata archaeon]
MECIQCGKEEAVYECLCEKCYLDIHVSMDVPEYVNVCFCPHCGAMKRGEHWLGLDTAEAGVEKAVSDAIGYSHDVASSDLELDIIQETDRQYRVGIHASLYVHGMVTRREGDTIVRIEGRVCNVCSRKHGNYYESIVQIRSSGSKLTEEEKAEWTATVTEFVERMAVSNRQVFLARVGSIHGGLDFYLSTTDTGKILSRELAKRTGAIIKESPTLAGKKDGRDIYRVTYSVRLPPFKKGDYILLNGEVYRVNRVTKDKIDAFLLKRGEAKRLKRDVDDKAMLLGGEEIIQEAVVVFENEKEVQLLDPETY